MQAAIRLAFVTGEEERSAFWEGEPMTEDDSIQSEILNYFNTEFDALEERLKSGDMTDYRERVLVSRKIDDAVSLLSPYVRSDPRARHLVRSAEALRKELLSVREMFVQQLQQKDQQSLLQAIIMRRRRGGSGETPQ
jgi:hypothetical protein